VVTRIAARAGGTLKAIRRGKTPGGVGCWLLLVLLCLAASRTLAGETPDELPFEVTAHEISYDQVRDLYTAQGNVHLLQGDRSLDAELAIFNRRTGRGVASGDVVVRSGERVIYGDFIAFETETLEGVVFGARLDSGPGGFRVKAGELVKTGEETYDVEEAVFTTCRCPEDEREPWTLESASGDMELGGYGKAKNSTIEIFGVPVLWLPWLMFPVKIERESGLLFPQFGIGNRNGVELGVPIFWAAREDLGFILTPTWLSKRGFKPELEMEYVYGKRDGGRLFGSYIHDKQVDPKQTVGGQVFDNPVPKNRWAVIWQHDQSLPGDFQFRADANFASDNQYAFDFDDLAQFREDRFLEAVAFAWGDFGKSGALGLVGSALYGNDVQNPQSRTDSMGNLNPFPEDNDEFILQQLPSLGGNLLPVRLGGPAGLVGQLGLDYVRFASAKNPSKMVPPPQPGAANDEGNRVVLYPTLGRPVRLFDVLEFLPEVGYQATFYDAKSDRPVPNGAGGFDAPAGKEFRGIPTVRAQLKTQARAEFDVPGVGKLAHLIEPSVGYTFLKPSGQNGNPIFVPQQPIEPWRLRELTVQDAVRRPWDRVDDINAITFGITNRLYQASPNGRLSWLQAELDLSGHYDFIRSEFGWLQLSAQLFRRYGVGFAGGITVNPPTGTVDEGFADFSYYGPALWGWVRPTLGARYRWRRQLPFFLNSPNSFDHVNQVDVLARLDISERFGVYYTMQYSFENGGLLLQNRGGVEYRSKCKCWAFALDIEDDPVRGAQVNFRYSLWDSTLRSSPVSNTGALGRL